MNSGVYDKGDPTGKMTNMTEIFMAGDAIFAVLFLGAQFLLLRGLKKKKDEEKVEEGKA